MPIYEFKCHDCGTISEKLLMGDESTEDTCCDRCGSLKVNRILSAAWFLTRSAAHPQGGHTCCGEEERCDTPPCSSGGACRRD